MKRKLFISLTILIFVFVFTAGSVFSAPLVIKDEKRGIGVGPESEQQPLRRDRSLQDGSLIYSMTPVYPEDVKAGTYDVDVISSSRFFKLTGAKLRNDGFYMSADITLSSTSYAYVYPGTAEEAEKADRSEWISADESDGYGQFEISVEALNKEMPCAAFSKKKQKWYDRDIVFLADSLPEDALLIETSDDGGTVTDTQEAAVRVIYIALAIIIVGGVINHFVKKKYYE